MKKFDICVDYKLNKTNAEGKEYTDVEIAKGNAELTNNYVETAVLMAHRDGLDSQYRRIWVKIQSKMQAAMNTGEYVVEFEDGEFSFIKSAVTEAKFSPTIASYVVALEDAILAV